MSPIQYVKDDGTRISTADIEHRDDVAMAIIKGRFSRAEIEIGPDASYCHRCHSPQCQHVRRADAIFR